MRCDTSAETYFPARSKCFDIVWDLSATFVRYIWVLHLCASFVCYICVLQLCATFVCYICLLHLCATFVCYIWVLHVCAIFLCYIFVLHLCAPNALTLCGIWVLHLFATFECYISALQMLWHCVGFERTPLATFPLFMWSRTMSQFMCRWTHARHSKDILIVFF